MNEHVLRFAHALPATVTDEKVYEVLENARELLRRLSGNARDIQFRHKIEDRKDKLGGPLGQELDVVYIQLLAKFTQPNWCLPPEAHALRMQFERDTLNRAVNEAAAKAMAEHRKELEKQVKAAKALAPESIKQLPGAESAPAHTVALDKMLITDEEIVRSSQHPNGVSILDGPMFPTSDDQVN